MCDANCVVVYPQTPLLVPVLVRLVGVVVWIHAVVAGNKNSGPLCMAGACDCKVQESSD